MNSFELSLQINGRRVNSAADLRQFTYEQLFQTYCELCVANAHLSNRVHELELVVADRNSLLLKIDQLTRENAELRGDVRLLQQQVVDISGTLTTVVAELTSLKNQLVSRQIGMNFDVAFTKFIFPTGRGKPFRLTSLSVLLEFLKNPTHSKIGGDNASVEWEKVPEDMRAQILQRRDFIVSTYPDIVDSITTLKDSWECAHPKCENYPQLVAYFAAEDEEVHDALLALQPLYNDGNIAAKIVADYLAVKKSP